MLDGAICLQTSVMRLLMEGHTQETSVLHGYADTLSTLVTNLKENFSPAGTLYMLFLVRQLEQPHC